MQVLKFGSSSLSNGRGIETIAQIVSRAYSRGRIVIVLSALKGAAADLVASAGKAESGSPAYSEDVSRIRERHLEAIQHLFPARDQAQVITPIQIMLNDLEDILHGVQLIRECSERSLDLILSFGARLACILVCRYIQALGLPSLQCDAREMIQTNNNHGNALVEFQASYEKIRRVLKDTKGIPVIAGGVACTPDGVITTLGRDGSDYTASLVGAALQAESIKIWTDVDGVMSADPSFVPQSFVIPALSYQEAMELSYFGARILHSMTMIPAMEMQIPIRIGNVLKPDHCGTIISANVERHSHHITGIASVDEVALVNIEGGGMTGFLGIAARIFRALAEASVNIMMISQASSEHSICLVFRRSEAERALKALKLELSFEIAAKRIQQLVLMEDVAILAIIGENMRGTPGISGRLFSALGKAEINVLAIAQGSSERNISFVIEKEDEKKALQTIHQAFLGDVG